MTETKSSILLADENGLHWLVSPSAQERGAKGFSLVEVLFAAGLISFLLVGTAEILIQSARVQRKTDRTLRLTGLLAAEAERIRAFPFDDGELAAGIHEVEIEFQAGDEPARLEWTVEDQGTNLKKVNFRLSRNGQDGPSLEAVLLLSRDLGF